MITIDSSIKGTIQKLAMRSLDAEIETLCFNDFISTGLVYYDRKNKKLPKGVKVQYLAASMIKKDPYRSTIKMGLPVYIGDVGYGLFKPQFRNGLSKINQDSRDKNLIRQLNLYYTDQDIFFQSLCTKSGELWMASEVQEQYEHDSRFKDIAAVDKDIKKDGEVVYTGGLGIGYSHFRLLHDHPQKIKEIHAIEYDPNVIELFNRFVRPQFPAPAKEKIKEIIHCDAVEYLLKNDLREKGITRVDLDIWQGVPGMVVPYLKTVGLERKYPDIKFSYWIEETFYLDLQSEILRIIADQAEYKTEKISLMGTRPALDLLARIILESSNEVIRSKQQFIDFISISNLKSKVLDFVTQNPSGVNVIEQIKNDNTEKKETFRLIYYLLQCLSDPMVAEYLEKFYGLIGYFDAARQIREAREKGLVGFLGMIASGEWDIFTPLFKNPLVQEKAFEELDRLPYGVDKAMGLMRK